MKTYVYIDGFNLYHGCVKYSSHKWLNLRQLCENMLPGHNVKMVKYFTARVSGSAADPDQPNRQMIYWRALKTLHGFEIIEGTFYEHEKSVPIARNCKLHRPGLVTLVRVIKKEEKGWDV